MNERGRHVRLITATGIALLVAAVLAVVFVHSWALALVFAALLAGAAALAGWWRAARAASESARAEERTAEWLESSLRERERELAETRTELHRTEQAEQREESLNVRLRAELDRIRASHGALSDTSDVREAVLQLALRLLGAEKGMLLARTDEDGDGDLDLVCALGFEHDPEHSAIAQRFASAAMDRDRTVREDELGSATSQEKQTPADREIKNLVAIPMFMADRFHGIVIAANKPGGFHEYDDEVLLALGDQAGAVLRNARLQGELRNSYLTTVSMLAEAIEAKDPFLRGHSNEVFEYVWAVAERLGLKGRQREELAFGSLLHDVGKLGISERILLKPGPLTLEERSVIELHPRIGYRIVQQVPALKRVAPAILHHHERYDGTGYPAKLKGQEIPLEARIICVADAFAAMTADRPYGEPRTADEACAELERCAGTQFDPEVVRLFTEEVRRSEHEPRQISPLAQAFDDPELDVRRSGDEPLFGYGSFEVVDSLTLLYSLRHFHELLAAEGERAKVQERPFAIVLVELTDLDRMNREDGFAAGDEALKQAARAVQRAAGSCGGTACRATGRRLAVVIPSCDEEGADECVHEIASELGSAGPSTCLAVAAWRDGEEGEDVFGRALTRLAEPEPARA